MGTIEHICQQLVASSMKCPSKYVSHVMSCDMSMMSASIDSQVSLSEGHYQEDDGAHQEEEAED